MGRAGRLALSAVALAGGAAFGYLAERRALRPRLHADPGDEPALGSLAGEVREVRGPDGLRITVESYGPEDAPQILLAHGWVCTGRVWHEQVRALSDRYRLITYDQPGHGRSSPPRTQRYEVDLFGDTLAAVAREATRPGPLVLCGHSLGGMSILNAVRRHPDLADRVGGVALLSTTSRAAAEDVRLGFGIHSVARVETAVRRVLAAGRPEATYLADRFYRASTDLSFLLTRMFGLGRDPDPRHVDFTEQLLLDSDFSMITGVVAPVLQLDEDESLSCLVAPTRVICGTADRLTPMGLSRRMVERCSNAELIEVPDAGHMTPLEAADVVNDTLERLVAVAAEEAA